MKRQHYQNDIRKNMKHRILSEKRELQLQANNNAPVSHDYVL